MTPGAPVCGRLVRDRSRRRAILPCPGRWHHIALGTFQADHLLASCARPRAASWCEVNLHIVIYRSTTIVALDRDGLTYRDSAGREHVIDFTDCRRNWLHYVQTSGDFPDATLCSLDDTTGVAWRDVTGRPAYIEFFTEPRTRFVFTSRRSLLDRLLFQRSSAWIAEFHALQLRIGRAGWTSFDLS
jgi:hypothetical protein